ncbi:hypothetical protein AB0B04_32165 [Streptomyces xinghaiensis]|uniref:Uncharacterized protein n=1 Tax=Streptomyces xinghaiensis TaxID=1038928 RepID=A0A3R7EJH6_9ACTN|nr:MULTISPECIES: hypothetical protein [Streptomyces]OFA50969.1 hypothetical protein BEN35_15180 [Streptomyces fradiae]PQM19536.1 hypothetical protein Sfr7A_31695 [Streptomyces xinghaiensis]RKM90960.1 hypothetical protein SFRA_030490 [Streptomyces xinghaiensis]RNC68961.1 hypothetical protein DC095_030735 [Streptomyces xinghaiensis]
MRIAHLTTAARDALAVRYPSEPAVTTLTITTTHHPARHTLGYDSEAVTARHGDSTHTCLDLSDTVFAEDLDEHAEDRLAITGSLPPLTLRLAPDPISPPAAELDTRTRLFLLSIHARAAAHGPTLTKPQVLTLANLAYETNDTARHDSPHAHTQLTAYQTIAAEHGLTLPPKATIQLLTDTARLAVRTMAHYTQPRPLDIELPAGHIGNTPAWLAHQAVCRFPDGTTRRESIYNTPALSAVLKALATLQTPATGDRLRLCLTDAPTHPTGQGLDHGPEPEAVHRPGCQTSHPGRSSSPSVRK